jgi:hypothetical protein
MTWKDHDDRALAVITFANEHDSHTLCKLMRACRLTANMMLLVIAAGNGGSSANMQSWMISQLIQKHFS